MPLLLLMCVGIATLAPTWPELAQVWRDSADYAHCYLIVAIGLGWFVMRALRIAPIEARPSWPPGLLLAAVLVAWLVAFKAGSAIGQQVLCPLIFWLAIWTSCGGQAARHFAAPLAFLYFAVPLWDFFLPWLQRGTIWASHAAMGALGVPVAIDDNIVSIPEGRFLIAEGCSGKRFFMLSLILAVLLASLSRLRLRPAALLVVLAGALSIVANWIRVIIVIYAGHVSNMQHYFVAREHFSLGWAIFAVQVAVIFWMGLRFASRAAPTKRGEVSAESVPQPGRSVTWAKLTPAFVLLCLPLAGAMYTRYVLQPSSAPRVSVAATAHWAGPRPPDPRWLPTFAGATYQERNGFVNGSSTVEVFVAQYQSQRQDAELINSGNSLLGKRWTGRPGAPVEPGTNLIEALAPSGDRWLISYFYQIGDTRTSSGVAAQMLYGLRSWLHETPSLVIATALACKGDCANARQQLQRFKSEALGAATLHPAGS